MRPQRMGSRSALRPATAAFRLSTKSSRRGPGSHLLWSLRASRSRSSLPQAFRSAMEGLGEDVAFLGRPAEDPDSLVPNTCSAYVASMRVMSSTWHVDSRSLGRIEAIARGEREARVVGSEQIDQWKSQLQGEPPSFALDLAHVLLVELERVHAAELACDRLFAATKAAFFHARPATTPTECHACGDASLRRAEQRLILLGTAPAPAIDVRPPLVASRGACSTSPATSAPPAGGWWRRWRGF